MKRQECRFPECLAQNSELTGKAVRWFGTTVEAEYSAGAIAGLSSSSTLSNNLYTRDGVPGGMEGSDCNGARRAHTITLGESVSTAGAETVYDVSGLTAIGNGALRYTEGGGTTNLYSGAGQRLTFTGVPGYIVTKDSSGGDMTSIVLNGSTLTMPAYDVTVNAVWWYGRGTATDPYRIATTNDLNRFAASVNGGKNYQGKYFLQTADLAYDNATNNYTPVGIVASAFGGTYDGGGHVVRGININRPNDLYLGLFGSVTGFGTVQNVTLAESVFVGYGKIGGIAGQFSGRAVSNCCVRSDVIIGTGHEDTWYLGGIAGSSGSLIVGCFSAASITTNGYGLCLYYGGVVGYLTGSSAKIKDCLYGGTCVEGSRRVGSIAGSINNGGTLVNNYYTGANMPGGVDGNDADGARRAYTLTLGEDIGIEGAESVYDVSGIAAIGDSVLALRLLGEGGTTNHYCGEGQTLTLTGAVEYAATKMADFSDVTAEVLDGSTLTMPDYEITVTVPGGFLTDWARLQAAIDAAENDATIILDRDYESVYMEAEIGCDEEGNPVMEATYEDLPLTISGGKSITIDLNGHTIAGCGRDSVLVIENGGSLTLTNRVEGAGAVTGGSRGVHVGGFFCLQGGAIAANDGGGVYVECGEFTMTGGTISGNTAHYYGGGVYVSNGGLFTMASGMISGNSARYDGGGVYVAEDGTFTMASGMISGNSANYGGGAFVNGIGSIGIGSFTMDGGEITGNYARYAGGGVYIFGGAFTMAGGEISENDTDGDGGGMYIDGIEDISIGAFTMDGGTISGNYARYDNGGVYLSSDGSFTMDGGTISGNATEENCGGV